MNDILKIAYQYEYLFESREFKSKSLLLNKFIVKYGFNSTYCQTENDLKEISIDLISDIYKLLNIVLFNNKLIMPEIQLTDAFAGTEHVGGYEYKLILNDKKNKFNIVEQLVRASNGKLLYPPIIKFGIDKFPRKYALITYINLIAHEMIHQYNCYFGNTLIKIYNDVILHLKPYNSHDYDFQKIMNTFNNDGLNIKIQGISLEKYDKENVRKICNYDNVPITLEQYLNENNIKLSELDNTQEILTKNMIFKQIEPGIYNVTEF